MKNGLRDLFTFSSGERKGIIALVFLVIVICGLNMILLSHQSAPVPGKYPDWMKDTGTYEEADNVIPSVSSGNDNFSENYPAIVPAPEQKAIIDPNTSSLEELILTGFSFRNARTIIRFREKGGRFRTPDDLKKIYGLTPESYQSVQPYIKIGDENSAKLKSIAEKPAKININTADSALFERLPGIGPVLAKRIIRYRMILGGYYLPAQIKEVYGMTDTLFLSIRDRLEADTLHIKKINLNTAEEKDMMRHPYIGRYYAAGIVKYRIQVGKIQNINELLINGLIAKDYFDKVKYYISL